MPGSITVTLYIASCNFPTDVVDLTLFLYEVQIAPVELFRFFFFLTGKEPIDSGGVRKCEGCGGPPGPRGQRTVQRPGG